jgi:hypothetical protein
MKNSFTGEPKRERRLSGSSRRRCSRNAFASPIHSLRIVPGISNSSLASFRSIVFLFFTLESALCSFLAASSYIYVSLLEFIGIAAMQRKHDVHPAIA